LRATFAQIDARVNVTTDKLDRMAEVCLEAHALIDAGGTPAMRAMIRLLLLQIGREMARRQAEPRGKPQEH
jgi:hypothetical protein